ncbi:hypothetical protein AJ80_10084 [Polytolypa hystricis UAMH7299]|uniref:Uncharacterized protein n=1 Tax=Polytolypa hystricis (strain UAMH7299) TaxID=1447883 RepID=A0A2B7WE46_POLH7|nr:hypothetical protein AJ80_10084 [Polytolypa hystricis UAMH7299]
MNVKREEARKPKIGDVGVNLDLNLKRDEARGEPVVHWVKLNHAHKREEARRKPKGGDIGVDVNLNLKREEARKPKLGDVGVNLDLNLKREEAARKPKSDLNIAGSVDLNLKREEAHKHPKIRSGELDLPIILMDQDECRQSRHGEPAREILVIALVFMEIVCCVSISNLAEIIFPQKQVLSTLSSVYSIGSRSSVGRGIRCIVLDPMVPHGGKCIEDPDDETLEKMAADAAGKELVFGK